MAALIRLTEAAEMPASLAASLTRRPAAISRRALSTFAFAIGGRPNLMLASRAAACPRRIRSRQFWRRWSASMAASRLRRSLAAAVKALRIKAAVPIRVDGALPA